MEVREEECGLACLVLLVSGYGSGATKVASTIPCRCHLNLLVLNLRDEASQSCYEYKYRYDG